MAALCTIQAKRKVLLPIIAHYFMGNAIVAKAVQRPVNSGPVNGISQLFL